MNPITQIRKAAIADLEAIREIYNEAILTTTATFDTEPKSADERLQWFQSHDERHPILVAVVDGKVVGWASLTPWSDRAAYDDTAETSFYVKSEFRGCSGSASRCVVEPDTAVFGVLIRECHAPCQSGIG